MKSQTIFYLEMTKIGHKVTPIIWLVLFFTSSMETIQLAASTMVAQQPTTPATRVASYHPHTTSYETHTPTIAVDQQLTTSFPGCVFYLKYNNNQQDYTIVMVASPLRSGSRVTNFNYVDTLAELIYLDFSSVCFTMNLNGYTQLEWMLKAVDLTKVTSKTSIVFQECSDML